MQGREDKKKKTCVVVVDLNWKLFLVMKSGAARRLISVASSPLPSLPVMVVEREKKKVEMIFFCCLVWSGLVGGLT